MLQTENAPRIGRKIQARIRSKVNDIGRAVIVLSSSGIYRVYGPQGIAAMSENAKKTKPWTMRQG
jgi:hypothetical protein